MAHWGKFTTEETNLWAGTRPNYPWSTERITISAHRMGHSTFKSHHKALPLSVTQMDGEMGQCSA